MIPYQQYNLIPSEGLYTIAVINNPNAYTDYSNLGDYRFTIEFKGLVDELMEPILFIRGIDISAF